MVTQDIALPWPPDWRHIGDPVSPLNPHSFAYGSFVFYFLKLFAHLLSGLGGAADALAPMREASYLRRDEVRRALRLGQLRPGHGRGDLLLGRRLYCAVVRLSAAAFVAFSVLHVQLAHFYASDTLLTLFIVVIVYLSVRVAAGAQAQGPGARIRVGEPLRNPRPSPMVEYLFVFSP